MEPLDTHKQWFLLLRFCLSPVQSCVLSYLKVVQRLVVNRRCANTAQFSNTSHIVQGSMAGAFQLLASLYSVWNNSSVPQICFELFSSTNIRERKENALSKVWNDTLFFLVEANESSGTKSFFQSLWNLLFLLRGANAKDAGWSHGVAEKHPSDFRTCLLFAEKLPSYHIYLHVSVCI